MITKFIMGSALIAMAVSCGNTPDDCSDKLLIDYASLVKNHKAAVSVEVSDAEQLDKVKKQLDGMRKAHDVKTCLIKGEDKKGKKGKKTEKLLQLETQLSDMSKSLEKRKAAL
jgi:hypothetical protein